MFSKKWDYYRRFGVELEINSFDNVMVKWNEMKTPAGADYVGMKVSELLNEEVSVTTHDHYHNANFWLVKPDTSCGMEVCTPVLKGLSGIESVCKVVDYFGTDDRIVVDSRCSVHVHVEVADLSERQQANVLKWWLKCEAVFLDSVPSRRKNNKYCQFMGLWDDIEVDDDYQDYEIIYLMGTMKYGSINTYHHCKKKRKTVEFRIMDEEACKNSTVLRNWIKILIQFVEIASVEGPNRYRDGDVWSGLCWLDPKEVFEFLKLEAELEQWFAERIRTGIEGSDNLGMMSREGRNRSLEGIIKIIQKADDENR